MKRTGSERKTSRSNAGPTSRRPNGARRTGYVICVKNDGYLASLQLMKVYRRLPDADAERHNYWRIIDEDREDYLFPARYFVPVALPQAVARTLATLEK